MTNLDMKLSAVGLCLTLLAGPSWALALTQSPLFTGDQAEPASYDHNAAIRPAARTHPPEAAPTPADGSENTGGQLVPLYGLPTSGLGSNAAAQADASAVRKLSPGGDTMALYHAHRVDPKIGRTLDASSPPPILWLDTPLPSPETTLAASSYKPTAATTWPRTSSASPLDQAAGPSVDEILKAANFDSTPTPAATAAPSEFSSPPERYAQVGLNPPTVESAAAQSGKYQLKLDSRVDVILICLGMIVLMVIIMSIMRLNAEKRLLWTLRYWFGWLVFFGFSMGIGCFFGWIAGLIVAIVILVIDRRQGIGAAINDVGQTRARGKVRRQRLDRIIQHLDERL